MAATNDEQPPLHILFFPFIAPGHLIPVADMAALFASRGVKCTILTTPVNAAVIRSTVDRANDRGNTNTTPIVIATVPFPEVGLPPGVENVVGVSSEADIHKMIEAAKQLRAPLDRFLAEHRPVDAVVADSFFAWAVDAAAQHGVPRLSFLGTSMLARACNDTLVRNNPLKDAADGPDAVVALPGLPHRIALRRSQLMDPRKDEVEWVNAADQKSMEKVNSFAEMEWDYYDHINDADRRSFGEVFNSFADLEPDYVDHYRDNLGRRVWLVGPLALATGKDTAARDGLSSEGERCLRWLDGKLPGSVVYICFGTLAHFSVPERRELARGLQFSGKNFLWVMGADDTDKWMPEGFADLIGDGERGMIFHGWAPQMLIMNHSAVGCFVTHCGWNSVLEAVNAGVPMVTWPRYADQFYNEKLIVEVLKVGVSLGARVYGSKLVIRDHVISGETIAEAIGGVMGEDEMAIVIRDKVKELGAKAKRATQKGGSSYEDVGQLIDVLMARRSSVILDI